MFKKTPLGKRQYCAKHGPKFNTMQDSCYIIKKIKFSTNKKKRNEQLEKVLFAEFL